MRFMNEYDIDRARSQAFQDENPLLIRATGTLSSLKDWADRNSDGWAHWPKPARAANKLMELIEEAERRNDGEDITQAELTKALAPIKAFCTRQGISFDQLTGVSA